MSFAYDALGRRIARTAVAAPTGGPVVTTTTAYVYDGEDILLAAETSDAGGTPVTTTTRYVHGPGIDEAWLVETGGQIFAVHADGLGSVTGLPDASQTPVETRAYSAFGQMQRSGSVPGLAYGYTGREWEPELGLYYYRARYYDPEAGRFIGRDPIGFKGGDANLYAYVGNDPVRFSDPSGLAVWVCLRKLRGGIPGNHAYLWDDTGNRCCGRSPGKYPLADCKEQGPAGDDCTRIAGSDGRETEVMFCCSWRASRDTYIPYRNDCVDTINDCLTRMGLPLPAYPPGGPRTGPCPSCIVKENPTLEGMP